MTLYFCLQFGKAIGMLLASYFLTNEAADRYNAKFWKRAQGDRS